MAGAGGSLGRGHGMVVCLRQRLPRKGAWGQGTYPSLAKPTEAKHSYNHALASAKTGRKVCFLGPINPSINLLPILLSR